MELEYLKPLILKIKGEIVVGDSTPIIDKIVDAHINGNDAIICLIYSQGGSTKESLKIGQNLHSSPLPTIGLVLGDAKSAAAIILQACEQRWSLSHSEFVFHRIFNEQNLKISSNFDSKKLAQEIKALAKKQRTIDDIFVEILKEKSLLSRKEINEIMDLEKNLSADEALKLGFIDRIISPEDKILKILLPTKPAS